MLTPMQKPDLNPGDPLPQEQMPSAIQLPPGLEANDLIGRSKKIKGEFGAWWRKTLEPKLTDTARILDNQPAAGSRPGPTIIPLGPSIAQTAQSRLKAAIGNLPKLVEATPRYTPFTYKPTLAEREGFECWMNDTLDRMPAQRTFLDDIIQAGIGEGVGVAEISWREDEETVPRETPDPNPYALDPFKATWKHGHAEAEQVSLWHLGWDPREKVSFKNATWVGRWRMVSANEMLRLEQEGVIEGAQEAIDNASREIASENSNFGAQAQDAEKDPDARREFLTKGTVLPVINYDDGLFRLDEWWASVAYQDPETGEQRQAELNYWICADEFLLKARPNPYGSIKPFATFPLLRSPTSVVGMSMIDLIKPALNEYETTSAAHRKVKRRIANTPTLNGLGSGLNVRSKLLEENSILNVTDVNQVKMAPIPVEILGALERSMAYLAGEIRQSTPANDQAQGIQQEGVDTATEAQILSSGSSSRFDWLARLAAEQFYGEAAEIVHCMAKLYAKPEDLDYTPARGEGDTAMLDPKLLQLPWQFTAATPVEEAWKKQRLNTMQAVITQLLEAQAKNPNLFVDSEGVQYQVDFMEFLRTQLLPLAGVSEKGLLKRATPMGAPGMQAQQAAAPVAAQPGLPQAQAPAQGPPDLAALMQSLSGAQR